MKLTNDHPTNESVLRSFFNICIYFTQECSLDKKHLSYIYNWGAQLKVSKAKLKAISENPQKFSYSKPGNRYVALEEIYNLVVLIYLDKLVEDAEIEILMKYAEKLGFPGYVIGDIVKSILTAPDDGVKQWQVKEELKFLLDSILD